MRKNAAFLFLSLFLLVFFACDLAIPKAIEIIGTPSTRFVETVDIGKMFVDLLSDAINEKEGLTMIPCPETDIVTSLIHADVLNQVFDIEDPTDPKLPPDLGGDFDESHIGDPLPEEKTLIDRTNPDDYMVIPLSELGSLLPGFKFYHGEDPSDPKGIYETQLYFSGTEILDDAKLEITIYEINVDENNITTYDQIFQEKDVSTPNHKSKFEKDWKLNGYNGESCPSDGFPIDIELTGNDIAISYRIYFSAGTTVPSEHFQDGNIKVEVVVWLPFKFIAVEEEAALHFPDDSFFSSEDDLFGRDEPDSESLIASIIERLSVDVKFNDNIFMGKKLFISSKGIDISNDIEGDTLSFILTEENMKAINDPENWPFIPDIKIGFKEGETLTFPKVFNAIEFAFKAKVRYRKDFE